GHAGFHRQRANDRAAEFDRVTRPARCPDPADQASAMSLTVQPSGSLPSTRTSMFLLFLCQRVWVASTCSTSDVLMPCASVPMLALRADWPKGKLTLMMPR